MVLIFSPAAQAQEDADSSMEDSFDKGLPIDAAREILARTLPAGATREQEIHFLLEREQAAFAVGSGKLRLEALRRLVELTDGTPQLQLYLGFLWREEWRSGNTQRAFEIGDRLIESKGALRARVEYAAQMSTDYLYIGERQRAREMLSRADRLLAEYLKSPDTSRGDRLTGAVELARSALLSNEGRNAEAEAAIRKAQISINRAVDATKNDARQDGRISLYESNLRFRHSINGRYVTVLGAMGRHVEAEAVAREGLQAAISEQTRGATVGYWNVRIGQAKLSRGRYAEAQTFIEKGVDLYVEAGLVASSERMLTARMFNLHALLGQEKWAEADAAYAAMLDATRDDAVGRQRVASPLLHSLLRALNGHAAEALSEIERSVRYRARLYGEKNPATLEAKAIRAMVLQGQGSADAALRAYREVFDVLFSEDVTFSDASANGLRGLYLPLAFDAFLRLVVAETAAGRPGADLVAYAFTVTDRLRSGRVQQAIVDSAARSVVAGDAELDRLVRAEQDVRNARRDAFIAINRHFGEIRDADLELKALRETPNAKDPAQAKLDAARARDKRAAALKAVEALREQVAARDAEQRKLREEIIRRYPAYNRLVNPAPVRPATVAKQLSPDEVLVSTYSTKSHTFVWLISARGEPVMHVAPIGAGEIESDVSRLRLTLDPGERSTPRPFNFAAAHHLYAALLQPLAPALAKARLMTVVASDALGRIPFAVLVREPAQSVAYESAAWLVKDLAIAHVASASAWLAAREAAGKSAAKKPFIGFGDPLFSIQGIKAVEKPVRSTLTHAVIEQSAAYDYGAMPALPETRAEILAIAKSLGADPASSTFFGAEASRSRVLSAGLLDYRVVAFATHGLKAGDLPDLSQPALAMAATAGPGESPLLTLDDVLKLKLAAEWVVLSACNTAASDGASDEAISGLGRGFFFAGARSMLVTHWAVESNSAQALVTDIFKHYAAGSGLSRAESVRQAQLDLISAKVGAQFSHPFFWAPYALIGDGAR
ncbi:MAG: CHAT domain-containing protein [Betaproteobacteria bacterium]